MNSQANKPFEPTMLFQTGSFTPPTPQELAAKIPNLEVLELLGQGGMGVVYKGRQPLLDRLVAIKVLRPDFGTHDAFQGRFLNEARTLAKLMHPYIVTVFDFGKAGDLYYLVMEYVEGATLRQVRIERGLTERDALDFVPQITEALEHAHEAGVVHRDVKPDNVLVDRRGRVRLVDFGLASLFGPDAGRTPDDNQVAGTLGYMAPEQFVSPQTVDHRVDIYATGVVFYEMLTGQLPQGDYPSPSAKAGTDRRLDPIVLRAMERDRELRYQEARHLRTDLLRITRTPESIVRIEREVPAPVEQVFAAWTDPAEMTDWYAPTDEFRTPIAEVDLKPGGRYRIGMKPPNADHINIVAGEFCRVDAPHFVSFTWAWQPPHGDVHETQVTLEFESRGKSTNVVLTHERFRDEELRKRHAEGWTGCLGRLVRKFTR
jgi:serine/threonine protein kinase